MPFITHRKNEIVFGDSPSIDGFGRARVSEPATVSDYATRYNLNPLFWVNLTAAGGAITHSAPYAAALMQTSASSGSRAVRQTKLYQPYQPGKSHEILMTAVITTASTGFSTRVGYYDDNNGIFFNKTGPTNSFVRRSDVSGAVVNTSFAQTVWNVDKMDGTGRSGINLDFTKGQIWYYDLEWLALGRVRCGFVIDGNIFVAHEINHANSVVAPYMRTATLPMRYEVLSHGGAATMYGICATCLSEGGVMPEDVDGPNFAADNFTTGRTAAQNTASPILSIEFQETFNSIVNRAYVVLGVLEMYAETKPVCWRLHYNPTLSTRANFVQVNANSMVYVDTHAATTMSAQGQVIASGYIPSGQGKADANLRDLVTKLFMTNDYAGTTGDIYTVSMAGIGGGATGYASLSWKEVY